MRVKNSWLLKKARGQQCTINLPCCNYNPETTVCAHIQLIGMGIMGGKTHDLHCAWACSDCHDAIDGRAQHGYARDWVRGKAYEGVLRTQLRLFSQLSPQEKRKLGEIL